MCSHMIFERIIRASFAFGFQNTTIFALLKTDIEFATKISTVVIIYKVKKTFSQ